MSRNEKKPMAAGFKRLFNSRHGKAVFPRAMKDELQFEAFLPFVSLQADDKTILTRGGELIQCIRVDGLNSMTSSDRDIILLKDAVAEILAQQGERYSVYVHKISRPFKATLAPVEAGGFAQEVDAAWTRVVAGRTLRDKTLTISIINRPAGLLSHGQKQFLEIGMLLMQEPHLLLLDEPVAGMTDAETEFTAELFKSLARKHSLMVVEHDMGFVGSIADHVTVLHQGSVLAEGSLEQVQNDERVIEVYLGR